MEDAKLIFLGYSPNNSNDLYERPKNFDYYFGKSRITKISRRHYSRFRRGILFGYYETTEEKIRKNKDGSLEADF